MTGQELRPRKRFLDVALVVVVRGLINSTFSLWRGFIPSNSLSYLYGLSLDVSDRRAPGDYSISTSRKSITLAAGMGRR
jgi:hypothetical protein